jgi:hypothetical protein
VTKIAQRVRIRKIGDEYEFTVDGELFPWCISADGFGVSVPAGDEMPAVTFTLFAEVVEVEHASKLAASAREYLSAFNRADQ